MTKKLIALAGAGAILLSVAAPALGWWGMGWSWGDTNTAKVSNKVESSANTGGNVQGNYAGTDGDVTTVSGNNSMTTGDAHAKAMAVTVANTEATCGCEDETPCWCQETETNKARVRNKVYAEANTGWNVQGNTAMVDGDDGGFGGWPFCGGGGCDDDTTVVTGNNTMRTGSAWSRSSAFTLVNTEMSGGE